MNRKTMALIGILVIAMIMLLYWFYPSKAKSFLTDEELINEINPHFLSVKVSEIQDIVYLDDNHVFVPYITTEGDYAISYWIYEKRKWQNAYTGTLGSPLHVKVHSEQYFLLNYDPLQDLQRLDFYLIKDRSFLVSDGIQSYQPRIQLKHSVQVADFPHSYSAIKLPENWIDLIGEYEQLIQYNQPDPFFGDMFLPPTVQFGVIAYDEKGEQTYPGPENGSGYGGGNSSDVINYLDPSQLEAAK
ncbi:hypothetical protein [Bacillus sp. PS06]|uniref:hypothetical protein n=1 Tax=Bacillus sp. PS06 TaxID=2764176 RepID=UPI00177BBDF4|nr:hypothetical protein [Bacillus sp. PS06]MBD8068592.1 hypothetical protein [Bacillus sp. PS06]